MSDAALPIRLVGFFPELDDRRDGTPSLAASRGGLNGQTVDAVAAYLDQGVPVMDVMESVLDPLDGKTSIPGGSSLVSDGVWVWRADLSYFVRKYAVHLPADFARHALSSPRTTPSSVMSRLDEILEATGWR